MKKKLWFLKCVLFFCCVYLLANNIYASLFVEPRFSISNLRLKYTDTATDTIDNVDFNSILTPGITLGYKFHSVKRSFIVYDISTNYEINYLQDNQLNTELGDYDIVILENNITARIDVALYAFLFTVEGVFSHSMFDGFFENTAGRHTLDGEESVFFPRIRLGLISFFQDEYNTYISYYRRNYKWKHESDYEYKATSQHITIGVQFAF